MFPADRNFNPRLLHCLIIKIKIEQNKDQNRTNKIKLVSKIAVAVATNINYCKKVYTYKLFYLYRNSSVILFY